MSLRVEQVAAPLVVLADYAALSWFPSVAIATGHPEAAFRVGTVFFVGLNAGVLLLGHRPLPGWALRAPVVTAAARLRVSEPVWWAVFAALAAVGIGYRLSAIWRTPLDPRLADMLPLISAASERLIAGTNPYRPTGTLEPRTLSPGEAWAPYAPTWLPGLWLPYVPAAWAGFDPRLVGLLATVLTAVVLGLVPWARRKDADDTAAAPPTAGLRVVSAGALLVAPAAVWFGAIGQTQTYWLYLAGLAWALGRGSPLLAGISLGLCVMSRHTVLPLVPLVGLYAWRGLTPRARVRLAAGTAAVLVALALPFGREGLWRFGVSSPTWYMQFGDQGWNGPRWWVTHTFGISSVLYALGWSGAIAGVGAALLLLVYGLAWFRLRDAPSCVRCLALTLLAVTISVPTPFRYEFFPIVVLVSTLPLLTRPPASAR